LTAHWDRRSTSEHDRVENLALARWLPSVATFTSHWAHLARHLGIDHHELDDRKDLDVFPTSRERDLIAAVGPSGAGLVLTPNEDQVKARADTATLFTIARSIRRGGQAGKRLALLEQYKPIHVHQRDAGALSIAYSRADLDRLHLAGSRAASVLGMDDSDYLVNAVPGGPSLDFWGVYHLGLGASILALHPRGHGDGLDAVVDAFHLLPTTAVAVALDDAIDLANLLAEARATVDRVQRVITVGPPPSDEVRSQISEAWSSAGAHADVRVRALWGPSEGRCLWAEQADSPGSLVTYGDLDVIEVVDALTGAPTTGGGDLVISSVGWNGTALVRYQTGAWVDGITREPDPVTGRTAPRIMGDVIPDAWQPTILTEAGPSRIDLRGVAATVAGFSSVGSWVVEVRKPTTRIKHDRVLVEVAGTLSESDRARLEGALPAALGVEPTSLNVHVDVHAVRARVDDLGSHFADLR